MFSKDAIRGNTFMQSSDLMINIHTSYSVHKLAWNTENLVLYSKCVWLGMFENNFGILIYQWL